MIDNKIIDELLDRPVAFHRIFVSLTGSVQAALMLSQAFYWSKRTSNDEGWFYKSASEWTEETGLSRHEQDTARKHLRKWNFWMEKLSGVPATTHYKVDRTALFSSLTEFGNLDSQFAGMRQTSLLKSGKHSITETTTETTLVKDSNASKAKGKQEQKEKEKELAKVVHKKCVHFWLKEFHVGWGFKGVDGKAMKGIIEKSNW